MESREDTLECWWCIQRTDGGDLVGKSGMLMVLGTECIKRFITACAEHVSEVIVSRVNGRLSLIQKWKTQLQFTFMKSWALPSISDGTFIITMAQMLFG